MNCYQCGSKLGAGQTCLKCGADVSKYRRIIHLSNSYYNAGLEKARLRDLSGAVEMLDRSLQLYKKNIEARNLLGLVYYEMGEVVEALCQWVISKNLVVDNPGADYYLGKIQTDRNRLDSQNTAIKKYNQALVACKMGNKDLAIVQLKRVLRQHPKMLKAYQLLALIYIDDQQFSKAGKLLKAALQIDGGNTLCLKYSRMIQGKLGKVKRDREKHISRDADAVLRAGGDTEDVLVPGRPAQTKRSQLITAGLVGLVAGLALYQFVISSTVAHNNQIAENEMIQKYDSKMADKELEVSGIQDQMTALEKDKEDLQTKLDTLTGENGLSAQYDALLNVVTLYMKDKSQNGDTDIFQEFSKIDEDLVDSEAYKAVYDAMKQYVTVDRISDVYKEAYDLYKDNYYKKAIPVFESVLELNPDYTEAMYYLAVCYEKRDDTANALKYYKMLADNYKDSEYFDRAAAKVESLGGIVAAATTKAEEGESSEDRGGEEAGSGQEGEEAANGEGEDGAGDEE